MEFFDYIFRKIRIVLFKTRVKFVVKDSNFIQIGYLIKDDTYPHGYYVLTKDNYYNLSSIEMIF